MNVVKDSDCVSRSPIQYGHKENPVFGFGKALKSQLPGKQLSEYDKKIFLPELLPLEESDLMH